MFTSTLWQTTPGDGRPARLCDRTSEFHGATLVGTLKKDGGKVMQAITAATVKSAIMARRQETMLTVAIMVAEGKADMSAAGGIFSKRDYQRVGSGCKNVEVRKGGPSCQLSFMSLEVGWQFPCEQ